MPTLKLKLVGSNSGNSSDSEYLFDHPDFFFTLNNIIDHLKLKGIKKDLHDVKFIYKGTTINSSEKEYHFNIDDEPIIYIFTTKIDIRNEFAQNIFTKMSLYQISYGATPTSINSTNSITTSISHRDIIKEDPMPDTPEDILTAKKVEIINETIVKQFSDPDFVTMLKICINKPHIVNMVTSYLNTGDIHIEMDEYEEFTYDKEKDQIYEILDKLDIIVDDDKIKKVLVTFHGHINLTLRYLLTTQ